MIGEIVESGGVHPGAAPQYQPGDVGAVDSEDLEKDLQGHLTTELPTCRVVDEQLTQSVMSRISNLGLFFKTGLRRSSVSQSQLCMTRDRKFVEE